MKEMKKIRKKEIWRLFHPLPTLVVKAGEKFFSTNRAFPLFDEYFCILLEKDAKDVEVFFLPMEYCDVVHFLREGKKGKKIEEFLKEKALAFITGKMISSIKVENKILGIFKVKEAKAEKHVFKDYLGWDLKKVKIPYFKYGKLYTVVSSSLYVPKMMKKLSSDQ